MCFERGVSSSAVQLFAVSFHVSVLLNLEPTTEFPLFLWVFQTSHVLHHQTSSRVRTNVYKILPSRRHNVRLKYLYFLRHLIVP